MVKCLKIKKKNRTLWFCFPSRKKPNNERKSIFFFSTALFSSLSLLSSTRLTPPMAAIAPHPVLLLPRHSKSPSVPSLLHSKAPTFFSLRTPISSHLLPRRSMSPSSDKSLPLLLPRASSSSPSDVSADKNPAFGLQSVSFSFSLFFFFFFMWILSLGCVFFLVVCWGSSSCCFVGVNPCRW